MKKYIKFLYTKIKKPGLVTIGFLIKNQIVELVKTEVEPTTSPSRVI